MSQYPEVKMYQLTQKEKEMIIVGLQMRRAFIETGDALTSAETAAKIGEKNMGCCIKALFIDQVKLIVEMDELIRKLYH